MAGPETLYTAAFVRAALPAGASRLLEIGCGAGELAASLVADGFEVVALDTDATSVAAARKLGVDACRAEWPDFDERRFDAILFTRSLHHVHDLEAGIAAAVAALAPGGRIVVEDFAYEEADEASLAWFRDEARRIGGDSDFIAGLVGSDAPLTDWWRGRHDHDLHPANVIDAALRRAARRVEASKAAYYFRYLASALPEKALAAALGGELAAIEAGAIRPLGRRWIAEP
jgi:SAM-dependent methyltransferase